MKHKMEKHEKKHRHITKHDREIDKENLKKGHKKRHITKHDREVDKMNLPKKYK